MATLQEYYNEVFCGTPIPATDFERLSMIANDVLYDICGKKPTEEVMESTEFQKAVCYEIEYLHKQGGVDAIVGYAESLNGLSESLGGYSVSGGGNTNGAIMAKGGIPVSPLALSQLRRIGLMCRWFYSGVRRHGES